MHYRLSPSSSHRWLNCPGSARNDLPNESNDAADEGTLAHEICAERLNGEGGDFDLPDEEMKEAVLEYEEFIYGLPDGTNFIEKTLESKLIPEHGGTIDYLLLTDDVIHVVDFKYGKTPVQAVGNSQLKCYLNLARENYTGRKRFFGSIVQPRVQSPQTEEFSGQELDDFTIDILRSSEDQSIRAGSHCKFCPLLVTCPVAFERGKQLANFYFSDERNAEECLQILEFAPVVSELEKIAKTRMVEILQSGEQISGWKLVESKGHRAWNKNVSDEEILKTGLGAEPNDLYDRKLKSPAKIEKLTKDKDVRGRLSGLVFRPSRGFSVVPESSRLPEYVPSSVFGELENE